MVVVDFGLSCAYPRWRVAFIHELLRETVRKALIGPELKPQKASKRVKKPYFATAGQQNGGSSGYSRPFSDSFRRGLLGNSRALQGKKEPGFCTPASSTLRIKSLSLCAPV